MPRKKNSEDGGEVEILEPNTGEPLQPAPTRGRGRPRIVKNFLTQEWEDETPGQAALSQPAGTRADTPGSESLMDDESDPAELLFADVETVTDAVSATVYELPDYALNGSFSLARARKVFCGTYELPREITRTDDLLQFVRERLAHPTKAEWHFLIVLRQRGRARKILPVQTMMPYSPIDKPPSEQPAMPPPVQPIIMPAVAPPPPAPPIDPLQNLEQSLSIIERVSKTLGRGNPGGQNYAPAPVQQNPTEITTEAALLRLISENPQHIEQVISRFLPGETQNGGGGDSWGALALKALEIFGPVVAGALTAWAVKMNQPQAEPAAWQPGPAAGQAPSPAAVQTAAPQAAPAISPDQEKLGAALTAAVGAILNGIDKGISADFTAETIDKLLEETPELDQVIGHYLDDPPETVLAGLAALSPEAARVCKQPHAIEYLREVQLKFKEDAA